MENQNPNSNFMLYLMLIVCSVLAGMNTIEIYRMTILWKEALNLNEDYFQICVKHQYVVKTFFSFFSFFATISALILTIGIIVDYIYFARKLLESYLNFVYYIFGPTLLISCFFALVNWKETVFICTDSIEKHFSLTNATSVVFCFLIGGVITFLTEFYSTMSLYSNTITRQPEGSKALYALFWYVSLKIKNTSRLITSSSIHRQNHDNNFNSDSNSNNNVNSNSAVVNNNVNLLVRENLSNNGGNVENHYNSNIGYDLGSEAILQNQNDLRESVGGNDAVCTDNNDILEVKD